MVNTKALREEYNNNRETLINKLTKYNNKELYNLYKEIRDVYELSVYKTVKKEKIIYKIFDYLLKMDYAEKKGIKNF